jgi:hypothetical protein
MKPRNLDAAIRAVVAEANEHGASLADIQQLIALLKQQAREDQQSTDEIPVPDDPKDAA